MASARTTRRRLVFAAVSTCASVFVALLLLEGVMRVFGLAPPLPNQYRAYISDPCLPFRKKPNIVERGTSASGEYDYEYRHNSQGFRDEEHTIEKPEGVFRILALGDSYTWGVGARYEETFLVRLENWLNSRGKDRPKVEIIKAGVPRYFPKIERLLLEHYGIAYQPDLIMAVFVPNDVIDSFLGIEALRPTSQGGYLLSKSAESVGPLGTWLYIHSHLARTALRSIFARTGSADHQAGFSRDLTEPERRVAWMDIEQEYLRMKAVADQIDAPLVLVHIPQASLSADCGRFLARLMRDRVAAFIDTQPSIRSVSDKSGRDLYWPKDGHCNADGYTIIARVLFDQLIQRGLVP